MYVKRVCYPVRALGPGDRVGIWVAGCDKDCEGCMSVELKEVSTAKNIEVSDIMKMIHSINRSIDGLTISGGEPFLQPDELAKLVKEINENYTEDIIIYTGYTLKELKDKKNYFIDEVLKNISILIDGEYKENLNNGKGIRGSTNQKIHIFKDKDRYENLALENQQRVIQSFQYDGKILLIGIG